ncbi:hypothetical protein B0H19DRAFT_1271004 [Mycena capillaripes]|nr:hypothetical protein B0H19DRAFT_1271004 [Mycena capillaripes]
MAPHGWTTPDEYQWLQTQMPKYILDKADKKLWQFWPQMQEGWFRKFPEEPRTDLTPVQALGAAIKERKARLENWFRHHSKKVVQGTTAPRASEESALAQALFGKKVTRKRAHHPIELYERRNPGEVEDALQAAGYFQISEEAKSADIVNGDNEPDEVHAARVKEAQSVRMTVKRRVLDGLYVVASEEEKETIDELIEEEKRELAKKKSSE